MKLNPPELSTWASYSMIDTKTPVAKSVGGLTLDYERDEPSSYGVFRVDIANTGRGAAENVRFQVKLDPQVIAKFYSEPDFKVYKPTTLSFQNNEFYVELATFPQGANDFVAFKITNGPQNLCSTRIKFINNDYEGKVSQIEGTECK